MGFNLCRATIQQGYEDEGWNYSSCTKCRRKVTLSGAQYWCFRCDDWERNPDKRFRLQLQIGDRYGVLDVTAFSEPASEILEISLQDMNAIDKKPETGEAEVRAHIMKIVGKEYLFRAHITENTYKEIAINFLDSISKKFRCFRETCNQCWAETLTCQHVSTLENEGPEPIIIVASTSVSDFGVSKTSRVFYETKVSRTTIITTRRSVQQAPLTQTSPHSLCPPPRILQLLLQKPRTTFVILSRPTIAGFQRPTSPQSQESTFITSSTV